MPRFACRQNHARSMATKRGPRPKYPRPPMLPFSLEPLFGVLLPCKETGSCRLKCLLSRTHAAINCDKEAARKEPGQCSARRTRATYNNSSSTTTSMMLGPKPTWCQGQLYNDDEGIWGQQMHLQVISKSATLQHQTVRQTRFSQNVFRKNIMMTALPWMITTKTLQ